MNAGRTGFTTGTCAAAAAKAATMILCGAPAPPEVDIGLPDGRRVSLPLEGATSDKDTATAVVRKDAGDDPDVTDGCLVTASVAWDSSGKLVFIAGDGVGTVTRPGLSIPPGEPAINPTPRRMIQEAVREVTDRGVAVTVSIPGGKELAEKTFNPRLGIANGLSILGTSGIVRPFSTGALRDALKCALSVATACSIKSPVFVPGRIGEKAAHKHFQLTPEQLVEVGNEWGFVLDEAAKIDFNKLLVLGHPGKLAKLARGQWDTHSARSSSAVQWVASLAGQLLGRALPETRTVEGIFRQLAPTDRKKLADVLSARIGNSVKRRLQNKLSVATVLVDMRGEILGLDGDISEWR
ncbi:MAG TPA: cobalt-precorrin-5B (C(1))-methyltransferase CbiD [Desulfomonilaceae bacterium]|nr:cobalt-precorrin-5B (C(1))-methyltransferase CbiD [Desulfomonilaceae bacterium]